MPTRPADWLVIEQFINSFRGIYVVFDLEWPAVNVGATRIVVGCVQLKFNTAPVPLLYKPSIPQRFVLVWVI